MERGRVFQAERRESALRPDIEPGSFKFLFFIFIELGNPEVNPRFCVHIQMSIYPENPRPEKKPLSINSDTKLVGAFSFVPHVG